MKYKKMGIIVLALAFVFGVYRLYSWYRFSAHKTASSKYFVTISGNISPHLKKPMYLGFWAQYAAYNPKCSTWVNWFAGVKGMPAKTVFYPALPNSKGDYVIKIPIDKYRAGRCDWKMVGVLYNVRFHSLSPKLSLNEAGDMMRFGDKAKGDLPFAPVSQKETLSNCTNLNAIGGCKGGILLSGYKDRVIRNLQYHFVQNIN